MNAYRFEIANPGDQRHAHFASGVNHPGEVRGLFGSGRWVGITAGEARTGLFEELELSAGAALEAVELGRFVLLDSVPGNGETWFLGRCFEQLRTHGLFGVVSFSDPTPRTSSTGARVFPGHVGTIYQAHNAAYLGRSTARTLRLLPDGSVFSARTAQKIRSLERGWQHAVEQLAAFAPAAAFDDVAKLDPAAWLRRWTGELTRTMRHPGNHRYAWTLNRKHRHHLKGLPYPKAVKS